MRSCLLGLKYEGAKLSTYGSAKLQYARKQAADEPVAAIMRLPQIATVVDANEPDCGCFKCKLSLFLGSLATSTKLLLCSLSPLRGRRGRPPPRARRGCGRSPSCLVKAAGKLPLDQLLHNIAYFFALAVCRLRGSDHAQPSQISQLIHRHSGHTPTANGYAAPIFQCHRNTR